MGQSIDDLYAFIAADDEGEGITAFQAPGGMMLPMVGADMERVESLRPVAQQIAAMTGKRIVVAKFSAREDLEIIEP